MIKPTRFAALAALLSMLVIDAASARAQSAPITVRSSRTERGSIAPGGVFTAPFAIVNNTTDSIAITQVITLPAGWTTVNSMAPSSIAPSAMELWLVSVAAPTGAAAGTYVLRAGIRAADSERSDSVIVEVEERYELNVRPSTAPTYVMSGESYEAKFVVRNRGNVATRVALKATSNHGASAKLNTTEIDLAPGASNTVSATVAVPAGGTHSVQDLLEVTAIDQTRDTVRASSSVETTIIPQRGGSDYWMVPGELALRSATAGAGVSPIVAWGTGRLSEKHDAILDFSVHSAAGRSTVFGERDEYRLSIRSKDASVRLGDHSFGFTDLTSSGSMGTGGEVRGTIGSFAAGAYSQRNRWNLFGITETAAMIGMTEEKDNTGSIVMLHRGDGARASQVVAGRGRSRLLGSTVEVEAAKSDSQTVGGGAGLVRVYGTAPTFSYDVGMQKGSTGFAGAQRGSSDKHISMSGQKVGSVVLTAMASSHTTSPSLASFGSGQRFSTASLGAGFDNGSSVEYDRYDRDDHDVVAGIRGNEQSLRLRGRRAYGIFDFNGTFQSGVVSQVNAASHGFVSVSASSRAKLGENQYLSFFTDLTDGRALGSSGIGNFSGGTSAEVKIAKETSLRMSTMLTAQRDRMADWMGFSDITVEQRIRGAIVSMRARLGRPGTNAPAANGFYLEVRRPLGVPVGRRNLGGQARARVIDAESGAGVVGALVRMGDMAAVTDKRGVAEFKGLQSGEYHAVVEGGIDAGQLVSGGNVNVDPSAKPATVTLSVAKGAHVAARLRRFEKTGKSPNGVDSLSDAGAVSGATLALISSGDTIWQSSDERGRVDFGSIAPGHYVVKVVAGQLPEFTVFEKKAIEIDVTAGENRQVDFRLVPQVRAVEFVGSETVLLAAPAKAPITLGTPLGDQTPSRQTPKPQAPRRDQKDQDGESR